MVAAISQLKIGYYIWNVAILALIHTREGQKVPATIFFLFTWVHLYKGGSVYIKYEPLSFMPCNIVLHAWLHYGISIKTMHFGHC